MIPKTNNWERTFFGSMVHTTSSCNSKILFLENLLMLFSNIIGPNVGDCVDDQFSISGGLGRGSPTICGTNTGYHSKCQIVFLRS